MKHVNCKTYKNLLPCQTLGLHHVTNKLLFLKLTSIQRLDLNLSFPRNITIDGILELEFPSNENCILVMPNSAILLEFFFFKRNKNPRLVVERERK